VTVLREMAGCLNPSAGHTGDVANWRIRRQKVSMAFKTSFISRKPTNGGTLLVNYKQGIRELCKGLVKVQSNDSGNILRLEFANLQFQIQYEETTSL
jgi:hypothetical protein